MNTQKLIKQNKDDLEFIGFCTGCDEKMYDNKYNIYLNCGDKFCDTDCYESYFGI